MEIKNYLQKKLEREILARKEAERIMEEKSLDLYLANEQLKKLNGELNDSLSLNINALQESEAEKFALFENAAVGVIFTIHDKVIKTNNIITDMVGVTEREILGKSILSLLLDEDKLEYEQKLNLLQSKKQDKFNIAARTHKSNGTSFWCKFHVSSVLDSDAKIKYHMHIIENIQERKAIKAKQETLISQLKEINTQLENFAHVVSHDLKAPLNGMHTVTDWIRAHVAKKGKDDTIEKFLSLIEGRVRKMYNLIDGVMEYSRVSQTNENKEEVQVKDIVEEALQLLTIPNNVQIRITGEFPTIYANRLKLKQIFLNLVDNASRHNDKKEGFIEISSKENKHFWIFAVRDNGKGIENRHLNKIFKIFNTLDTSGKHTGIGLALVRKIVEHYNGKITVDSTPKIETIFTFTLDKDTVKIAYEK